MARRSRTRRWSPLTARRSPKCSAEGMVNGYTADATLFFPEGVVTKGRKALTELYGGFVKPPSEEGLCGLKATPVLEWESGSTSFAKFKVTAPFLAKRTSRPTATSSRAARSPPRCDLRRDETRIQEDEVGLGPA
ncbi:MAG TPA: hypothetical protein VJL81_09605 [Solirubrobacterales bacterium]|nr:hypothetical protein [Solirubrobacterales bacterium]